MIGVPDGSVPERPDHRLEKIADLLGGERTLSRRIATDLDAHDLLVDGLPVAALDHLVGGLLVIQKSEVFDKVIGVNLRRKSVDAGKLDVSQGNRIWRFAEVLVVATEVFGTQQDAESWLQTPAIGLDQNRPIDLLGTPVGIKLVEQHLERMALGVYA